MTKEFEFKTKRLKVRTIKREDAEQIVRWRSDKELIRYYYDNRPITLESHLEWYENCYLKDDNRVDFIIMVEDEPIGFLALNNINTIERKCEIGYTIAESKYRGIGMAKEAILGLIEFAQHIFHMRSIVAGIHKENIASSQLVKGLGFKQKTVEGDYIIWNWS